MSCVLSCEQTTSKLPSLCQPKCTPNFATPHQQVIFPIVSEKPVDDTEANDGVAGGHAVFVDDTKSEGAKKGLRGYMRVLNLPRNFVAEVVER